MPIDLESLNCSDGTTELLWHLQRMTDFLKQHEVFWRAHLVDFFQERLWDKMDKEWLNTLKYVVIQDLLTLPMGVTQDNWPSSLQEFVDTARCLSLFRKPKIDNHMVVEPDPIKHVLSEGMNQKKLHEGYLAQVLCFQYNLPVLAIDCCSHHMDVTSKRAARIQKHYKACSQKGPTTLTCHMGPMEMATLLPLLCSALSRNTSVLHDGNSLQAITANTDNHFQSQQPSGKHRDVRSIVVAGLHACGDLSANMLRSIT